MLSEAKHLAAWRARPFPFVEFTLEQSEGLRAAAHALRVTRVGNLSERLWGRPYISALHIKVERSL